jgi:hypothetical protein
MRFYNPWNAFVGWLTLLVGRRVLRRKVDQAVQVVQDPKTGGAIAGAVAAGSAVFIWLKRRGGEAASA